MANESRRDDQLAASHKLGGHTWSDHGRTVQETLYWWRSYFLHRIVTERARLSPQSQDDRWFQTFEDLTDQEARAWMQQHLTAEARQAILKEMEAILR